MKNLHYSHINKGGREKLKGVKPGGEQKTIG